MALKRYVPLRELHFFLKDITGKEPISYTTKEALIVYLENLIENDSKLLEKVNELVIKYKNAGRGSVSWSIPKKENKQSEENSSKGFKNKNCDKKEFITNLIIKKNSVNPFENEIRPSIGKKPSLNKCEWLRDDLLKLEFVYADKSQFIEEDYEIKEIFPTRRASILARVCDSSIILESRASFNKAKILHEMTADMLGEEYEILDFSLEDVEHLKTFLNAKKKSARHKKSAGDFDTVEVTLSPILDDLDSSKEYKDYLHDDELRKAMYKFGYITDTGSEMDVTMYVSNKGSLWFVSEVPEEVIEHVFSGIREIKGF